MERWLHVRNATLMGINRLKPDGPLVPLAISVTVEYSDGTSGTGTSRPRLQRSARG